MIRAVTVTNYLGESKRFELAFPEESGFAVQSISGLGPSKADISKFQKYRYVFETDVQSPD